MKIKDLDPQASLGFVQFYHPKTGKPVYWISQWGYPDGKAGVWYKERINDTALKPIFLDTLKEALEWDVVVEGEKRPKKRKAKKDDFVDLPF